MIQEILINAESADTFYNGDFDGVEVRLRFQWIEDVESWFLSLYSPDGSPILLTRRLVPNSSPVLTTRAVPGLFFVVGDPSVPKTREALGTSLRLFYSEAGTTFEEAFG